MRSFESPAATSRGCATQARLAFADRIAPCYANFVSAIKVALTPSAVVLALVCVGAAPARAQNVDVAVEMVQVTPTAVKVNDIVTIIATLRRLDPRPANTQPVDVLVQLFVDDATTPISTQTVTLRQGETVTVRTQWKATEGKHELRAKIAGLSARRRTPRDVRPSNDEARSAPIVVTPGSSPSSSSPAPSRASEPRTITTDELSMVGAP